MTFKGYTIVYEVDFDKKEIFVFHIFNKNLPINIKKDNKKTEAQKDKEDGVRILPPDYMQFELKAGYSKIETIFKGAISIAKSKREGANFVTTIEHTMDYMI